MEQKSEAMSSVRETVRAVHEKMWGVIAKDSVSSDVRRQWRDVVRAAARKLDAPSMNNFRSRLQKNADFIGKTVAIAARAQNILTSVLLGGVSGAEMAIVAGKIQRDAAPNAWKRTRIPAMRSVVEGVGAITVFGVRPVDRIAFIAGKAGRPVAEKIARVVNTIALKREQKIAARTVYVGIGKA